MSAASTVAKDNHEAESKANEPSMEDILASIRRIIADDQGTPGQAGASAAALRASGYSPSDAVVQAAGGELALAGSLISPETNASVNASFLALFGSRFVQQSDVIIAMTQDMLKPMLKAWLDEYLPSLVERLVKAEIERVARGE
ncbi:PopZ family protein [Beijerinckia indica]|uniref:DUF2497 domain-containing protein n=1 Tax=Beijerinckia indica subsp. indica (strain ATCC 9039 / DSM 1715 / NCIMB 8712) TaxID=395963 RepID=B2ICT0_BEII9|nr:DUF2497 domain-containing protein [Beijerinckia indica]ACB95354.1 conserved hypothetical protein [Beijerinckia indica subsp. indica ATCC 9039]